MSTPAETQNYRRTLYRGGGGMWTWIFHRGSGLAVLGFLFLHILDTSLVGLGPEHYNKFVELYKGPIFRPLEVLLMGLVIFHAFNGLKVIALDFWPRAARLNTTLNKLVIAITLILFLPAAVFMLKPMFG